MFAFQRDNNPMYKQLPDSLQAQVKQSILNAIIEETIILDQAKKAQLRVSDLELAKSIKMNPQFQKEGKFDLAGYNDYFRPGFLSTYGIDFEQWTRKNMLRDKLDAVFTDSLFFSDAFITRKAMLEKTEFTFKKIVITPAELVKDFNPESTAVDALVKEEKDKNPQGVEEELKNNVIAKLKLEEGEKRAEKLKNELWPLFKNGKLTSAQLEQAGLKEIDTPSIPLAQINQVLSGDEEPGNISQILKLNETNPTPSEPIVLGNSIHFIKLVKKTIPQDLDAAKKELATSMPETYSSQWISRFADELIKKASININN
ncbi:MAG: hypothetical protein ACD_73C00062G0001 [uncultured bacterium]|nr:MAG: hypothetical protein ACD_73C00062G0001 [uncultured bacterium]